MEKITLFMNNRSQIIHLPKTMAMPDNVKQINVVAIGRARVITPAGEAWDSWFDGDDVSADFMANHETS